MTTGWIALSVLGAVVLLAAWRPEALRDLITRAVAFLASAPAELVARLGSLRTGLSGALRQLAVHGGIEVSVWRAVERLIGGLLFTAVAVLGLLAEWALMGLTFASFFDTSLELPGWMPSAENLSAAGLVIAPAIFGVVLFDLLGSTHLTSLGERSERVRWWLGVVCTVGILAAFLLVCLGGWSRGGAAWEASRVPDAVDAPIDLSEFAWPDLDATPAGAIEQTSEERSSTEVLAKIVTAGTPLVLGLATVFAGTGLPGLFSLLLALPAMVVWLLTSAAIVLLGLWLALMNGFLAALLSAVTWIESLVRPDAATGQWWAPARLENTATRPNERLARAPHQPTALPEERGEASPPEQRPGGRGNGADLGDDANWSPLAYWDRSVAEEAHHVD